MKTAIVTGASRGLGKAIAHALAGDGYDLFLSARSEQSLHALKADLHTIHGVKVRIDAVDFNVEEAVSAYGRRLAEEVGTVDVLVNNLGIFNPDTLEDVETFLDQHMRVNFYGAFHLTQALLKKLENQGHGHIFNVLSVVNHHPRVDAAGYTISKFALFGYHRLLQKSLKPKGIKVTGLFPSSINTSSWDGVDAPKDDFVQPEDIASLIVNVLHMQRGTVVSDIDLRSINPDY